MSVTDDEVTEAMHLVKGDSQPSRRAGVAPFAAALRDQASIGDGESIGVIISGGNVSSGLFKQTPEEGYAHDRTRFIGEMQSHPREPLGLGRVRSN